MHNRHKFLCLDCGVDTGKISEHYMLKDEVWSKIHNSNKGMLCVGCAEVRLGRVMCIGDFNDSHVNKQFSMKTRSRRLSQRMEMIR